MAFTLALAYAPGLGDMARPVQDALAGVFPGILVTNRLEVQPPQAAFDTARGWYDAPFLLSVPMPMAPLCDAMLWLVEEPLGNGWRPWILGAAGLDRAVVSTLRLSSVANISKVAAHEVGHLLGLAHCGSPCLMRIAAHEGHLASIPLALCDTCRQHSLQSALGEERLQCGDAAAAVSKQ
jgi:predicted Zn-dependent protease